MTQDQVLLRQVSAFRTRIRLLITQKWLCVSLTVAVLIAILLVAATKLQWWTDAVDYIWALIVLGGIVGLAVGWTRQITPLVAAQIADERAGLQERLSTAVELSNRNATGEVAEAQIADAARHAGELRPGEVLPWRPPHQARYLVTAVALLLAAIYVPELSIFHSRQDLLDRKAMQDEGVRIQQIAREVEKKLPKKSQNENEEILRRVAAEMKKLGKDQSLGRMPKKAALLKMNELQKQLKETERKMPGAGNATKSMEKVSSDLRQAAEKADRQGSGEAAKSLRQMADHVDKKDFEGAKRQLEELARKMQEGKMSPDEAAKAADMLQQMAQSMQNSNLDPASKQMKDAAKQLQKAAEAARQMQKQMAGAKTDAERKQIQQQMAQAMQQGSQIAGEQTQKAGGT